MTAVSGKTNKIHVLQVVGEPVGGIRKHIHSIIEGLDDGKFIQSYAHSTTCVDAKFERDLERFEKQLKCVVPLLVKKRPGIRDLINLYILARHVRATKVDIIHGHGAKGGLYARIVARVCGVRSVYTPHGGVAHSMFSKVEDALYVSVEKLLYGRTGCFVFESNYTAHAFHRKIGRSSGRWVINYNGVSIPDVDNLVGQEMKAGGKPLPIDSFHIGVFGLLRMQKGQEYAVRAVAKLVEKDKSICLHIFGDGPDREMLEGLAMSLSVTGNVIFYGDVTDVDVHINRMDAVLVPSLFESFGYVAVEAMALGKLVVASNVGGLREVVSEKTGIFFQPGDVSEIEKSLMLCMEHPKLVKGKAVLGRDRVETEFSLDKMIVRISKIYEDLAHPMT